MLTKTQIDKLHKLEIFHFEESQRLQKERDAVTEKWHGNCNNGDDYLKYHAELQALDHPFFNLNCCTKMENIKTVITDDGFVTMTWTLEWDHDSIKVGGFHDGVKWANKHGAGIPI